MNDELRESVTMMYIYILYYIIYIVLLKQSVLKLRMVVILKKDMTLNISDVYKILTPMLLELVHPSN